MKNPCKLVAVALMLGLPALPRIAAASDFEYCVGIVEDWEVARWGALYVDGTWNNTANSQLLCYLDGSWGGVSSDVCKAWMLTIQGVAASGQQVNLKYLNVDSCDESELGKWGNTVRPPEYIRVY